jgi:hypothetical protein
MFRGICVLTLLTASFAANAIQSAAAVQSTIQKEMNGYVEAMKRKDVKAMEKVVLANFDPAFKDVGIDGKTTNRQQTIASMKRNVSMLKSIQSMSLKIVSCKIVNGKAMTTEHMQLDATLVPMSPGAKNSRLKVDSMWNGVYVHKGSKWMCISSKTTKEKATIDGKTVSG